MIRFLIQEKIIPKKMSSSESPVKTEGTCYQCSIISTQKRNTRICFVVYADLELFNDLPQTRF